MVGQHKQAEAPAGESTLPEAGSLDVAEVTDERDTTARVGGEKLTGKRVRAIPYMNATTTKIRRSDFKNASNGEIDHPDVLWDFRKEDSTVPVGESLSQEAADFLTKNYPETFEYINDGE